MFFPSRGCRLLGTGHPLSLRHLRGSGLPALKATLTTQRDCGWVFFFGCLGFRFYRLVRRGLIHDLAGHLIEVELLAGALRHGLIMADADFLSRATYSHP